MHMVYSNNNIVIRNAGEYKKVFLEENDPLKESLCLIREITRIKVLVLICLLWEKVLKETMGSFLFDSFSVNLLNPLSLIASSIRD